MAENDLKLIQDVAGATPRQRVIGTLNAITDAASFRTALGIGTGTGDVVSVNSITPDVGGNVQLTAGDLGALAAADVGGMAYLAAPVVADLAAVTAIPATPAPFQYWYYKALSGDLIVTDAAAGAEGNGYVLTLIGDGTARVFTFPSSYSEELGGNRTTFTLAVNQQVTITRKYVNGIWRIYGDPATGVNSNVITRGGSSTPVMNGTVARHTLIPEGAPTVPGGTGSVTLSAVGTMNNNSGTQRGLTFNIKHGGVDIMVDSSTSTVIPATGGERQVSTTVNLFYLSGSLAWLTFSASVGPVTNAPTGFGDLAASSAFSGTLAGSSTLDNTVDRTLDIELTFTGTDNAGLTWTTRAWELRRL